MVGTLCVKLIVTRMPFPSALSTLKHFLITELARIFFALRLPAFGDIDEGDDAIRLPGILVLDEAGVGFHEREHRGSRLKVPMKSSPAARASLKARCGSSTSVNDARTDHPLPRISVPAPGTAHVIAIPVVGSYEGAVWDPELDEAHVKERNHVAVVFDRKIFAEYPATTAVPADSRRPSRPR